MQIEKIEIKTEDELIKLSEIEILDYFLLLNRNTNYHVESDESGKHKVYIKKVRDCLNFCSNLLRKRDEINYDNSKLNKINSNKIFNKHSKLLERNKEDYQFKLNAIEIDEERIEIERLQFPFGHQ